MSARPCTIRLFWTLIVGLTLLISSHLAHAESIELHNISKLIEMKSPIKEAFDAGQTIRIFGDFFLHKKYFKNDLDLVFSRLENLQNDLNKMAQKTDQRREEKLREIKSKNRELRLQTISDNGTQHDQLYNLVVAQANVRINSEKTLEDYKKNNRVLLRFTAYEERKWITHIKIIRGGRTVRNTLPKIQTATFRKTR